jgi:hypothetical protein
VAEGVGDGLEASVGVELGEGEGLAVGVEDLFKVMEVGVGVVGEGGGEVGGVGDLDEVAFDLSIDGRGFENESSGREWGFICLDRIDDGEKSEAKKPSDLREFWERTRKDHRSAGTVFNENQLWFAKRKGEFL